MRKKILIITPFYPPNIGGAETFCEDLKKELSAEHDVTVCTIDWKGQKIFAGTGLRQFWEVFPRLLPKAIFACRRKRFDRVLAIGLQSAAIGATLCFLYGIRPQCVLLAIYDFKGILAHLARVCLKSMTKIYVEGEVGKKNIEKAGINPSKIVVFQHWCDQEIFKPKGQRNKWKMRVLFVGRPIPEKGKTIIETVETELKHLKGLEFIYVENCRFEDLPKYYQMADVVVVPSLYPEGISRVVIEAASCGCALLTSSFGALSDLVDPFGVTAYPCPTRFKRIIKDWYLDRPLLEDAQKKAFEYAQKNFSKDNAKVFL